MSSDLLEAVILLDLHDSGRRRAPASGEYSIARGRGPSPSSAEIALRGFELVDAADHLVDRAEAELRHDLAHSSATKNKKFTTCSGLPANFSRSTGSCVATPTGQVFEVAHAHHDAARRDERRGGEAQLLGAEQRGDHHVAAGLQADRPSRTTMRLRRSFITSIWCVSARPSSHGRPGVLDRGQRRRAGAAVVTARSARRRRAPSRRRRRPCRRRLRHTSFTLMRGAAVRVLRDRGSARARSSIE